jgi:putative inorganic carbon (hco3(-)) transporter
MTAAVILLPALAAAILAQPQLATLLVVAAVWLNVPGVAVTDHGVPQAVGALYPLPLLLPLAYVYLRGRPLVVNGTFVALLAFGVVATASAIFAIDQATAVTKLRELAIEGLVVYILVLNVVRDPQTLRRALWALVFAGSCLALVSVYQKATGTFLRPYNGFGLVDSSFLQRRTDVARLAGPLGDPNYYAQILVAVVPVALLAAWREQRKGLRLAGVASALLMCVAITFTYSRGAAIGLLAVIVGMAILGYLRARQLAAVALVVALIVLLNPGYRARVESVSALKGITAQSGAQVQADESVRSRTTEMGAAALAFFDHPLIGVGLGNFPAYYQQYAPRVGIQVLETTTSGKNAGDAAKREAHNIVLGEAADTGLLGLAAFVAAIWTTLYGLRRARRRWFGVRPDLVNLADSLTLALVGYLVAGLFLTLAFERYLWLLLALAGAAGALALSPAAAETKAARRST